MTNSIKSTQPKMAKAGKLEIAINHFTTDITSLPYWMDGNCYIVFSLLWRRYISASINERLITPDGWYQYTMKSLMEHCGFKDKGTLHRTVEGLYRSGLVDVRVEDGSRMWACWKMNKKNIEYVASIPDRDAMQEPYINSINTIGSKDKNFTYKLNKEGITELMKFFMVNTVENLPLFNTISQEHCNTTLPYYNNPTPPNNYSTLQRQDYTGMNSFGSDLEKEFEEPLEDSYEGASEQKSKDEIDAKERPSQSQSLDDNPIEGSQDLSLIELPGVDSVIDSSTLSQLNEEENPIESFSLFQSISDKVSLPQVNVSGSPERRLSPRAQMRQWAQELEEKYKDSDCPVEKVLQDLACESPESFGKYVRYLRTQRSEENEKHKGLIHDLASAWGIDID